MSVTTADHPRPGAPATELWRMSALELAGAIRSKQASSREVVEAHLHRIEAVNPSVNAVTMVPGGQAVEAAGAADRAAAAGSVPLGVGALSYAGTFTIGVAADRDAFPDLGVLTAGIRDELHALGVPVDAPHGFPDPPAGRPKEVLSWQGQPDR